MKTYHFTCEDGKAKISVTTDQSLYALPHVVLHSPTGFGWGYGGSGPGDAALSILADYFQEDHKFTKKGYRNETCPVCYGESAECSACDGLGGQRVQSLDNRYHMAFKWAFLSNATLGETFTITEERIKAWVEMSERSTP